MRAARTTLSGPLRFPTAEMLGIKKADAGKINSEMVRNRNPSGWKAAMVFGGMFFAGYLGGILKGKLGDSSFAEMLASYYRDPQNFTSVTTLFADQYSGVFLQAVLVLACGFSAVGSGFLGLYFVARGAILGLCAAEVYMQGGTRALVVHWLLTCLPDLGVFLVMLWLAIQANRCALGIFTGVLGSGSHLRRTPPLRQLLLRFVFALLIGAGICILGAASGIVFAGVLL